MEQTAVSPAGKTNGITMRDKIGYAFGDMGCLLTFSLIGAFLQMFYTDVLQLSLANITVLMLVARIWDAVNDPIWGSFVDSRKPNKNGKFRPYLLWVSVPLAIAAILLFYKVPGLTENQYLIYAYVTYIAYGMMYTAMNVPYGSLASVVTDDTYERSDLSVYRSVGAGLGGLPGQILLPLFVYSTAVDTGVKYLDASKLSGSVAILAGCSVIIFYFCFRLTKERVVSPPNPPKMHMGRTLKTLVKNRPFIVLCLASMLLIAVTMYVQTIYNYLYLNYFERPELYSLVTICTYAPMAILFPFLGKMVRAFGKKNICAYGTLLSAGANLFIYLIRTDSPYVFLAGCFFSGLGATFFTMEMWGLVTDVIDYQEYLSGAREEGTSYSLFSFTRKLGQTIAGSGGVMVLSLIGYNVDDTTVGQAEEVLDSMYTVATLVPAGAYLLMFLLLYFLYPLGKHRVLEIQNILTERRQEAALDAQAQE
ncbi:MAG: MFS transporter [Clostridiales bacterium]|nr:MFS transporter [Clostridiales bacterium]